MRMFLAVVAAFLVAGACGGRGSGEVAGMAAVREAAACVEVAR